MDAIVTPQWLHERLDQPGIKVLDATWYMPNAGKNAVEQFRANRIAGSSFFDIDGIADPTSGLPHMLPDEGAFGAAMDALGVTSQTHVVLYDRLGVFSAPRAWWTFKVFGHEQVSVLAGGLPAWTACGYPLDESPASEAEAKAATAAARAAGSGSGKYVAKLDASKVRSLADIVANIGAEASVKEQVMDARSAGRFEATEPEPRTGLRGGHIPGSRSVPFPFVLDGNGQYKSPEELKAVFKAAGVDVDKPLVASCGSGLTACVLALGVYLANGKLIAVYDGSWMEWGSKPDTPIATGPASPVA